MQQHGSARISNVNKPFECSAEDLVTTVDCKAAQCIMHKLLIES